MIVKIYPEKDDCSFNVVCSFSGAGCDKEKSKKCEFAKEFSSALFSPCPVMEKLKERGLYSESDISCDMEKIRCIIPAGKCVFEGECIRAVVPELRRIFNTKREKYDELTKAEVSLIKSAVKRFYFRLAVARFFPNQWRNFKALVKKLNLYRRNLLYNL